MRSKESFGVTGRVGLSLSQDYKAALRTLRDISSGGVRLPIAGADAPGTGSSGARLTDRERPLTQASMKGFI